MTSQYFTPGIHQLKDANGNQMTFIMMIANSTCMVCKQPITTTDGSFYALDSPYFGVLHRKCCPDFSYNGRWPHEMPGWAFYM
jgi:hypothetical protein